MTEKQLFSTNATNEPTLPSTPAEALPAAVPPAPFVASDADLTRELFRPRGRVRKAEADILRLAGEMNLPITFAELRTFALLLTGFLDEQEEQHKSQTNGEIDEHSKVDISSR